MSESYLNHALEKCFQQLTDLQVCEFDENFDDQKEFVDGYWERKPEVNFDEVLLKDIDDVIDVIKRRRKLKKVTMTTRRLDKYCSKLSEAIARNCSELEDLEIPALKVSKKNMWFLSACVSLKSMYIGNFGKHLKLAEKLVTRNQNLQIIRLCGRIENTFFAYLPKTLKGIEFIGGYPVDLNNFLDHVQNWKLERLGLSTILHENDLQKLSTQTTLKYLSIRFNEPGDFLHALFLNNPQLEDVRLGCPTDVDGSCLEYLSPTLRKLKLYTKFRLNTACFVACVKSWNLETLQLNYCEENEGLIMKILQESPVLTKLVTGESILPRLILVDQCFSHFIPANQLKTLHLTRTEPERNYMLLDLLESCRNLEELKIDITVMNHKICKTLASLPNLKKLILDHSTTIPIKYADFSKDLSQSKSLTSLHMTYCKGITERMILPLLDNCKTLLKLEFISCSFTKIDPNISKSIIMKIMVQEGRRQLLSIVFEYCTHLSFFMEKKFDHPNIIKDVY